jgi:hypothetical protein
MGTMDLGSWFTQSSLSIYVDDHIIDDKIKCKCHALMITIWWLHVLKYIVERSTHMCSGVTLVVSLRVWTSHSTMSYFSLFIPR